MPSGPAAICTGCDVMVEVPSSATAVMVWTPAGGCHAAVYGVAVAVPMVRVFVDPQPPTAVKATEEMSPPVPPNPTRADTGTVVLLFSTAPGRGEARAINGSSAGAPHGGGSPPEVVVSSSTADMTLTPWLVVMVSIGIPLFPSHTVTRIADRR